MGQLVGFEIIVLGVVPVYDGVIETDLQTLLADGVHDLTAEVTADQVVGIVGGVLRVEQAEAIVVFAREYHVSTSGPAGKFRPLAGEALFGAKERDRLVRIFPRIRSNSLLDPFHAAALADRFVLPRPGQTRVEPPVNEHAETALPPPLHSRIPLLLRLGTRTSHIGSLFFRTHRRYQYQAEGRHQTGRQD